MQSLRNVESPEDIAIIQRYIDTSPPHSGINIAILGAGGVGKRCARSRIVYRSYIEEYDPTEDYSPIDVHVLGRNVKTSWMNCSTRDTDPAWCRLAMQMWDQADGCLLMFTCTQASSFEHIKLLYETWLEQRKGQKAKNMTIFVVAGKYDFADSSECNPATIVQAELFCLRYGLTLLRVSPRTGFGLGPDDVQNIVKHTILGKVKGVPIPQVMLSRVLDDPRDVARIKKHLEKISRPHVSIAILGSGGVGKRCARIRIVQRHYSEEEPFDPTLLEDNRRSMNILGHSVDTEWFATPELHSPADPWWMSLHAMNQADAGILMFDSCRRISFEHLKALYYAGENNPSWQHKKVFVAMSKVDLLAQQYDTGLVEDAEHFCERNGLPLLRLSAKSGRGFSEEDIQNLVLHVLLARVENDVSQVYSGSSKASKTGFARRLRDLWPKRS